MARELILVVDDDPDIVELLCCILHDAGYEVATADGDAALSLAQERQPHLILLDILMPEQTRSEAEKHLLA
jgi:CheY-like chemotaxis protein